MLQVDYYTLSKISRSKRSKSFVAVPRLVVRDNDNVSFQLNGRQDTKYIQSYTGKFMQANIISLQSLRLSTVTILRLTAGRVQDVKLIICPSIEMTDGEWKIIIKHWTWSCPVTATHHLLTIFCSVTPCSVCVSSVSLNYDEKYFPAKIFSKLKVTLKSTHVLWRTFSQDNLH